MQILKVRGHSAADYHPCMVTLWSADFAALQGELDLGIPVEFFVTKSEASGPLQNGFWLPFCAKF